MLLPGESQGQGSLVGCSLWGRTESDTTEATWQQQQQLYHSGPLATVKDFPQDAGNLPILLYTLVIFTNNIRILL